jgi:hypothetical protein
MERIYCPECGNLLEGTQPKPLGEVFHHEPGTPVVKFPPGGVMRAWIGTCSVHGSRQVWVKGHHISPRRFEDVDKV